MDVLRVTAMKWYQATFADDPTNEVWGWDLDLAQEFAKSKTPEPLEVATVAYLTRVLTLDVEHALSDRVDPSFPLLFALVAGRETASPEVRAMGMPEAVLIDGSHRLYRAVHDGWRVVPAVFLEPEEEQRVRLPRETVRRLLAEREALEAALGRARGRP